MTGSSGECPRLLATSRAGKEAVLRRELEDLLYHVDPGVRVEPSGFRDLLLVFSSSPPEALFAAVARRPPSSAARCVPVSLCVGASLEEILAASREISRLLGGSGFRVECSRRGSSEVSCRGVEIALARILSSAGAGPPDPRRGPLAVKVEIVGDRAFIGVVRAGGDRLRRGPAVPG